MAQSIKVGSLVKYKDHEGNLNGGTVISFKDGNALINTLEDKKVQVKLTNCSLIERNKGKGRVSNEEKEKILQEFKEMNANKMQVSKPIEEKEDENECNRLIIELSAKDKKIDELNYVIDKQAEKLNELEREIERLTNNPTPIINESKCYIAYKGMKEALILKSLSDSNLNSDVIEQLAETIDKLVSLDNN
jgi:hypothetical protein